MLLRLSCQPIVWKSDTSYTRLQGASLLKRIGGDTLTGVAPNCAVSSLRKTWIFPQQTLC